MTDRLNFDHALGRAADAVRPEVSGQTWRLRAVAALASVALLGACTSEPSSDSTSSTEVADTFATMVSDDGAISFPANFPEGFMFIGSWAVVEGSDANGTHAVFSRPQDVEYFKEHGSFPDGAVLIKEVSNAVGAQHSTGKAFWTNERQTWFLLIKDTEGRFADNPLWGDGWGWAQFDPQDSSKQIATDYKADCLACHVPVKDNDWIYTYAYPVLGPKGQTNLPEGIIGTLAAPAEESADTDKTASAGQEAFDSTCTTCHSAEPGKNGIGPSLAGVVGRKAGQASGYDYSAAMKSADVTWTPENLDKHIADPNSVVPDNKMAGLFAGEPDGTKRQEIIDYLKTLK